MLSENIKTLREQRGLTQAELAEQLHIVRQTVSKWEKGLSLPDAEMLLKLAAVLQTTVNELLDADEQTKDESLDLAARLAMIHEQLALRNRRTGRIFTLVGRILLGLLIGWLVLLLLSIPAFQLFSIGSKTVEVNEVQSTREVFP